MHCKSTLVFLTYIAITALSGQENKPWEMYGLSQIEWKLLKDNSVSIDKMKQLLESGIGIQEYVEQPWIALNLTESQWITKRRSGLTSYDIELETQTVRPNWKQSIKQGFATKSNSSDCAKITALTIPGYQQLKADRNPPAGIMLGIAAGAVGWCVVGSISKARLDIIPIVVLLIPDMAWSYFDFKKNQYSQKESSAIPINSFH